MKGSYKAIFVPPKLHKEIKLRAVKKGVSIIEYLEVLIKDKTQKLN